MLTPEDNRNFGGHPVTVISDAFWRRRFNAAPDAIGRDITFNGSHFTIVGVAPPGFAGVWLESPVDAWVPVMMQADVKYAQNYSSDGNDVRKPWPPQNGIRWLDVITRADRPDGPEAVALNAVFRPLLLEQVDRITDPKERALTLDRHLVLEPFGMGFSNLREQFRAPLVALLAMVGLLLLIACANTANLLLARATSRQREMAVRLSIGASRGRIIGQLLIESLLLGAIAAAVGLAIAPLVSELLVRMTIGVETGPLPFSVGIDRSVFVFTVAITLLTSFLFGFAPAWRATDLSLSSALKASGRSHTPGRKAQPVEAARRRTGGALAVPGGGRRAVRAQLQQPGLAAARIRGASAVGLDQPESRRLYAGGVAVSLFEDHRARRSDSRRPLGDRGDVRRHERMPIERRRYRDHGLSKPARRADPAPGESRRTQILFDAGDDDHGGSRPRGARHQHQREIRGDQRSDGAEILQRPRPDRPAIRLRQAGRDRDHRRGRRRALQHRARGRGADGVLPLDGAAGLPRLIHVRTTGDAAQIGQAVRSSLREIEPRLLVDRVTTIATLAASTLRQERLIARLTTVVGFLALALASLGLYGLMAYAVKQRTAELGVRFALGAPRPRVLWMVFRESLMLVIVGLALGLPLVMALARLIGPMLFEVSPNDPVVVSIAAGVLLAVGASSSYLPAWRASRVDPLTALRTE